MVLFVPSVWTVKCSGDFSMLGLFGFHVVKKMVLDKIRFGSQQMGWARPSTIYLSYIVEELRRQKQSKNQIFLLWNMHQLMSTLREYWNIFDQICKLSQKSLPKYPLLDEDKYLHYLMRLPVKIIRFAIFAIVNCTMDSQNLGFFLL